MRSRRERWSRVAFLMVGSGVLLAAGPERPNDLRREALRLESEGRFVEALPLFDAVLARSPRDIDARNRRGAIYLRLNQPARALADLDVASNTSAFLTYDQAGLDRQFVPDVGGPRGPLPSYGEGVYPSAVTNRGIALLMLGRDDEAAAEFRRSIDVRLAYPTVSHRAAWSQGLGTSYCGLGQAYFRKSEFGPALDAFNRSLQYSPGDPNVYVGRGETQAALGRFDDALNDYAQALRLNPNHARAYAFRARTLEKLGRDAAALGDADAAVRLDPSDAVAQRTRGAILSRLGRSAEALAAIGEALRLQPGDAAAWKDRGGIYNQIGQPEKGLADLNEALRLDPTNPRALQNRAASYNALGRFDEALRDADAAVRAEPANAGARNNRGLALIGLGRYEDAVTELTEAVRLRPGLAPAYLNRGGALAQLGRFDEAAADYDQAVQIEPRLAQVASSPAALKDLVRVRPRTSADPLALKQSPAEAVAACDRGNVRRALGDWAGAIAEYDRAVAADPRSAEAYALRGWSKLCAGEPGADADARAWFGVAGWRDPFAPSMALLGVLAARRDGRVYAADAFLDEALANTRPPEWPAPLFRYLKGQLGADELLAAATGPDQAAVAHATVGCESQRRGKATAAAEHFRWVVDHGPGRSLARDLAREALRQLTPPAESTTADRATP